MKITDFKYFYPERPRLIHISQVGRYDRPGFVAEPKYNGTRLELHHLDGAWQFWGRHGDKLVYSPAPEVAAELENLSRLISGYWVFDGELRHNKAVGVKHKIIIYDVFIACNELLTAQTFNGRRGILESIIPVDGDPVGLIRQYPPGAGIFPPQGPRSFEKLFKELTQADEIEGLVIKAQAGTLNLGRSRGIDSAWMVKVRKPSGRYHF